MLFSLFTAMAFTLIHFSSKGHYCRSLSYDFFNVLWESWLKDAKLLRSLNRKPSSTWAAASTLLIQGQPVTTTIAEARTRVRFTFQIYQFSKKNPSMLSPANVLSSPLRNHHMPPNSHKLRWSKGTLLLCIKSDLQRNNPSTLSSHSPATSVCCRSRKTWTLSRYLTQPTCFHMSSRRNMEKGWEKKDLKITTEWVSAAATNHMIILQWPFLLSVHQELIQDLWIQVDGGGEFLRVNHIFGFFLTLTACWKHCL